MIIDWKRRICGRRMIDIRDYLRRFGPNRINACSAASWFGCDIIEGEELVDALVGERFVTVEVKAPMD